jgi:hypothetical protein
MHDQPEKPRAKPYVILFYGSPGVGKTHDSKKFAHAYGGDSIYRKPASADWFNGYTNQKVIILDDFCGNIAYDTFLLLLDGEPMLAPTKGGFVSIMCEYIIITSMGDTNTWYDYTSAKPQLAVDRRIHKFVRYTETTITDLTDEHHRDVPVINFARIYPEWMRPIINT